jgi:sulfate/thiosulfate-binding protein
MTANLKGENDMSTIGKISFKTKVKKWSVLTLTGALTLSLAACGSSKTETAASSAPTAPPTTTATAVPSTSALKADLKPVTLLNVSYDPTRELYVNYNKAFAKYWKDKTGQDVTVKQSHGGSGSQARAVADGLAADVVTLALGSDINSLVKPGLLGADWQKKFENNSTPYTSTIVLLVRKGNKKGIKDWNDLIKPGIEVITPNPKTSGGARWNFLAAWDYALKKNNNDEAAAKDFVGKLYKNVKVLDSGARDSTNTFVQKGLGDVLIAWENEAYLAVKETPDVFEIITPSQSILAEPPVAIVDKNVDKNGTKEVATAYLQYLYSEEGQTIAAQNFYRPRLAAVAKKFESQFKQIPLVTIDDPEFGGWTNAQAKFFADKGIFDQIYTPVKK